MKRFSLLWRSQNGKVGIWVWVLGALLAVVAVVTLGQIVLSMGSDDPNRKVLAHYQLLPMDTMPDSATFEEWQGLLECQPLKQWGGFERKKSIQVSDLGILARNDGDTDDFYRSTEGGTLVLAEMAERFEWWRGIVNNGKVELVGWYTEGNDKVKSFSMTGLLSEGVLRVSGERGPRNCTYTAEAP